MHKRNTNENISDELYLALMVGILQRYAKTKRNQMEYGIWQQI